MRQPFGLSIGQVNAVFLLIALILNRVEYDFHLFIVATINMKSNVWEQADKLTVNLVVLTVE